jgi:hypothetical protein
VQPRVLGTARQWTAGVVYAININILYVVHDIAESTYGKAYQASKDHRICRRYGLADPCTDQDGYQRYETIDRSDDP